MNVDVTKPEKYVVEDVNNKALYKPETIVEEGGDAYTIMCDNGRSFLLYYNSTGDYLFREKTEEELSKEANEYLNETLGTFNDKPNTSTLDWNKPIEFVDPVLKDIAIEKHHRLKNSVYLIIQGVKVASIGYNDSGIATDPFLAEKVFNTFLPDRTINIYHIKNKESPTQQELDEVLKKCGNKRCNNLESSLKEDLHRVHEALKDSLLRVESQAFAIFVKEHKGTNIAEDYYQFRKLASRFK